MAKISVVPKSELPLKTRYFTFTQGQVHFRDGSMFDSRCVVEITAPEPRLVMERKFKKRWSMEYKQMPPLHLFRRGIIKVGE